MEKAAAKKIVDIFNDMRLNTDYLAMLTRRSMGNRANNLLDEWYAVHSSLKDINMSAEELLDHLEG